MKLNALLLLALTLWMCKSILNSCRLSLRCDTVTEICNAVEMHYKVFESIKCSMRFSIYRWHKKTGTFEKPNKNWRNPRKNKIIDKNWTIATCLLRESNPDYQCLKITSCRWRPPPRMHSCTATTTESHSAEHATHTGWHKRTGTFEMRSGSERMNTRRRTPSTGRNYQTLIIWITVS